MPSNFRLWGLRHRLDGLVGLEGDKIEMVRRYYSEV